MRALGMSEKTTRHPARTTRRRREVEILSATATAPAPQHLRALAQANRVRLARAELKRQVAEGEVTVAEVVLSCPWEAESMTIADLLTSQHRWGQTRCRRFLNSIPMSENKTIGTMTDRQRNALAAQLRGEPAGEPAQDGGAPAGLPWFASR
jgi:hypothetical protein